MSNASNSKTKRPDPLGVSGLAGGMKNTSISYQVPWSDLCTREQLLEGELPQLSIRILELIRDQGRLKMSNLETLTGESRSTIKLRLNELIERSMLKRNGRGPNTWYTIA